MAITAKVKLGHKQPYTNQGSETPYAVGLTFVPDYADGRNKEWAYATPSLSLAMSVIPQVAEKFEVGQAYTLTFSQDGID